MTAPDDVIDETVTPDSTGGVVSAATVTLTPAETVTLPAASRATAVSVWDPAAEVDVFQAALYGATVSSAPILTPSTRNCTPATPTLSAAVAETVTVPDTVAPTTGAVIDTVGGVPSSVVKVKSPDVARLPAASRERIRK